MKKIVEYLKKRIVAINENNGSMTSFNPNDCCVISGNEAQKIIDFYELHKKESEATPKVPDITPEWDTLDEKFKWVAIDPDGVEIAFIRKPQKLQKYTHGCNAWVGRNCQSTGRFIDMANIDWTKTLSKRPQ